MNFVISIDGLDASGKETLCKALEKYYTKYPTLLGFTKVLYYSFPAYNLPSGKHIKEILSGAKVDLDGMTPLQSALMNASVFAYNRLEGTSEITKKILGYESEDILIILDRYVASNAIYQTLGLDDEDFEVFIKHLLDEFNHIVKPDISIFLDVDIEIILDRLAKRTSNKNGTVVDVYEKSDFMIRCYKNAQRVVKSETVRRSGLFTHIIEGTTQKDGEIPVDELVIQVIGLINTISNKRKSCVIPYYPSGNIIDGRN